MKTFQDPKLSRPQQKWIIVGMCFDLPFKQSFSNNPSTPKVCSYELSSSRERYGDFQKLSFLFA